MKIHAQETLKRHLQFYMFIAISLFSLITMIVNLKTIAKFNNPYLIAIDTNGTRIISGNSDPIFKTEATAFIQRFVMNIYNFTPDNFMQKLGPATAMMSESLWKSKKNQILSLKDKVESEEISLSSQIQKITKDESGTYFVLIETTERSRLNSQTHEVRVAIKLSPTNRTSENPYGMEVASYEESSLR